MRGVSYILGIAGIISFVSGLGSFNSLAIKVLPFLSDVKPVMLMIIGAVLIVLALLLLRSGSTRQTKEVPIYRGNKVVGYRRH